MEYIYNQNGEVIRKSSNLRGIREHCSKNIAEVVEIASGYTGIGTLFIRFKNGDVYWTVFSSYDILTYTLSNWRNLYGTPLKVNGELAGVVGRDSICLRGHNG